MGNRSGPSTAPRLDGRFVPLMFRVKDSLAWRALSLHARLIYMELRGKCDRDPRLNNGRLFLSTRDAADTLGICQNTAIRGFHELQAKGFIVVEGEVGHLGYEGKGKATLYRLTCCGTRERQEPTRDFLRWQPGHDFEVRRGTKPAPRRAPGKQKPASRGSSP